MGILGLQKMQMGQEVTAGTAVAATAIWRGPSAQIQNAQEIIRVPEQIGIAVPTVRTYSPKLLATLAVPATEATFEQIHYMLEGGIAIEVATQDGAGTDYIYNYVTGTTSINTLRYFTLESGDNSQALEMEYAHCTDFTLSSNFGESMMMSSNWVGRQASQVSFTGALSQTAVEEILGGNGTIYLDATSGSYGGTQLTAGTVLSLDISHTTGWKQKFTVDNSLLFFHSTYFDVNSWDFTMNVTMVYGAASIAEYDNYVGETYRLCRLLFDGSAFGTPGTTYSNHTLLIDVAGYWESMSKVGEQDGNSIIEGVFKGGYDTVDASALDITVVNELTALT